MRPLLKKIAAGLLSIFFSVPSYAAPSRAPRRPPLADPTPLITADHTQAIYRHVVEHHWVPDTGLFISFSGTQDHKLSQQASTYEQAAMGLLAIRMGDTERAKGLFHFLRSAWQEGPTMPGREGIWGLANFYNAEFGGAGIEKTIHLGPNAWVGLFAAKLGNTTGDEESTAWALDMARWMMKDLPHVGGGVAMGQLYGADGIPWPKVFSTENNLSYYAFLTELLRANTLDPKDRLLLGTERSHVEDWLVKTAFDRLAYSMNRGVNPQGPDRTRALDTMTWLISAVGPKRLAERGLDPDRLMRQAQQSFGVNVDGQAGIDATDQSEADLTFGLNSEQIAPRRGTARPAEDRHRLIWYEGLGQYINALNTMAGYEAQSARPQKSIAYAQKARQYIAQYDKAALKNVPSTAAYAYATYGKLFHDGWYTPMDALDGPPSSLISAVWRCYAGLGFDPLAGGDIPGVPAVRVSAPKIDEIARLRPSILYGTSEDMVGRAWDILNQGDSDHAIQQAQATIQEWSPWALKLQEKKARKVGHLIDYSGMPEQRKEIFAYWALNDVAAAYFILGKAFDAKGHYAPATGAFRQIALNYSLAQVWDPQGWFWSPLESIREEFAERNPRRYGNVLPQLIATTATSRVGKQPF